MNRYLYKTIVYSSMFGLGVFHLAPYYEVWSIVLYYICMYTLLITLILSLNYNLKINKYDKAENIVLIAYMVLKMTYHITQSNQDYNTYLCSLNSELWAGVFTFVALVAMFSFQIINVIRYVKER